MKCIRILAVIIGMVGALPGCEQIRTDPRSAQTLEERAESEATPQPAGDAEQDAPLLLEDDEPLLLLDEGGDEFTDGGADNSRCFVCHINYAREKLAVTHARANIGCKECHGASDAHIDDESWAVGGNGTPPEKMYPRETINAACMHCHPKDKIDTEWHEPLFAAGSTKVCTDCHGEHRLPERRLKWK